MHVGADEDAPSVIEEVILPDLPQGWTATEIANNPSSVFYRYDGPQGEQLFYDQNPINPNAVHAFDSEHSTVTTVALKGGYTAQLFAFESGTKILFWSNRYTFTVSLKDGDDALLYQVADDLNQKAAALTKKSEFSDFLQKSELKPVPRLLYSAEGGFVRTLPEVCLARPDIQERTDTQ